MRLYQENGLICESFPKTLGPAVSFTRTMGLSWTFHQHCRSILPGPWDHPRFTKTMGPSLSFYQHYGSVCEVFDHSKDIFHPVAELKIIHLRINHLARNVSNDMQVKQGRQISRLGSYIASKLWRATSTLMVIKHAWIVVDRAIPDQQEKVRCFWFPHWSHQASYAHRIQAQIQVH